MSKFLMHTGILCRIPCAQRWLNGHGEFLRYYSDRAIRASFLDSEDNVRGSGQRPGAETIDLSQGSPIFDWAPSGSTKLPADRRGWPPPGGLPELRAAIVEHLAAEQGWSFHPTDEVTVTLGAAGAWQILLDSFVNPGDRVVLLDPTAPLYAPALRHRRARIRWLACRTEDGRLRFRTDQLARSLYRARLIVLTSPANPSGGILTAEDLEQIAWWAARRDALIVSDEVYARYRYDNATMSIAALPGAQRRTLTMGSVSKGFALASARVGWLAGCRSLIRACSLTASLQAHMVPTLCQYMALSALQQPKELFDPIRTEFDSQRHYVFERLQALGLNPAWPAGGYFFWMPVWELGLSGRDFVAGLFRSKKVLLTPGDSFGPSGQGYVRLSFAADGGRLREGLARLADYVREVQLSDHQNLERRQAA